MRVTEIDARKGRKTEHAVADLIVRRWSPRAMTGEPIDDEQLGSLLEAARWAPSSSNAQPWRFLYARRGGPHWDTFRGLLVEGNRIWADKAAVLMVVVSRKRFEWNDKPSVTHAFDAGAAWENLALQATAMGLVAHGMAGFDYDRARSELEVPDVYDVQAMIAVGRPGLVDDLPEKLRERETPSDRRPLAEIAIDGPFRED